MQKTNPSHQSKDKVYIREPGDPIDTSDPDDDDDDDDVDSDGHRNVGIIRTTNTADSPRKLHQIST
jgi:hypothetical protein